MQLEPINGTTCVRCGAGGVGYTTVEEHGVTTVYGHCDACMDEPKRLGPVDEAAEDEAEIRFRAASKTVQWFAAEHPDEVFPS